MYLLLWIGVLAVILYLCKDEDKVPRPIDHRPPYK